jgi:hypothetical protein
VPELVAEHPGHPAKRNVPCGIEVDDRIRPLLLGDADERPVTLLPHRREHLVIGESAVVRVGRMGRDPHQLLRDHGELRSEELSDD